MKTAIELAIAGTPELTEATKKEALNSIYTMIGDIADFTSNNGHVLKIEQLQNQPIGITYAGDTAPHYIQAVLENPFSTSIHQEPQETTLYAKFEEFNNFVQIEKVQTLPELTGQITKVMKNVLGLDPCNPLNDEDVNIIDKIVNRAKQPKRRL